MITITRRQARRLRGVFRRYVLGIAHRGLVPPLVFRADGSELRAQHRYHAVAVEHVAPASDLPREAIALPLDALADIEGRDDSPVFLVSVAPDRTRVRWTDHGVPQSREYDVVALDAVGAPPDLPASWTSLPADFLSALAEASATTAEDATRYALNCLQLRGTEGEVAATDGRQMLIQSGFALPWTDAVLVRRSPLFASRELPRDQLVAVGRTETHVVLRIGPWTLFLEIQAEGRFPVLGSAIPDPNAVTTRLRLDIDDARFLRDALDHLPGSDEPHAPTTLDLNGVVAVRAQGSDRAGTTELVLPRSSYSGTPIRLSTGRIFLRRAVRLGFTQFEMINADVPLACRDRNRLYCWQPLNSESAIAPSDDVTRIEPQSAHPAPPSSSKNSCQGENFVASKPHAAPPPGPTNGSAHDPAAASETTSPAGLAALIQEAESLHDVIADVRSRSGRLILALRKYRKRERLVASTLASLKALRLQEVTEAEV
jgi:hypothetical protein